MTVYSSRTRYEGVSLLRPSSGQYRDEDPLAASAMVYGKPAPDVGREESILLKAYILLSAKSIRVKVFLHPFSTDLVSCDRSTSAEYIPSSLRVLHYSYSWAKTS
jgi:hypothetical protein